MAKEDKTKVVKKYVCSTCHGTGGVTCSKCGGKGERKCPHCDGTGHACPVCSRGYVKKKRLVNCSHCYGKGYTIDRYGKYRCYDCGGRGQIEETYKEICPNCHGDYKNTDHVCDKCDGHKKISCAKFEICPDCGGKGKWSEVYDKASKCNLGLFRAFSMAFGFSGLQYLYVGHWCLFVLQFATFALLAAVVLFWDPNGAIAAYAARFCAAGSNAESVKLQTEVFLGILLVSILLIGMFTIKRDRQGGLLSYDFKKGWYWLFLLLFGWIGAHLAYVSRKARDLCWCFAYDLVITPIVVNSIMIVVKDCVTKDFDIGDIDIGDIVAWLIVYGTIPILFMGVGTKFAKKMMGVGSD